MRSLAKGLQEHLDERATTLCWCWKLIDNNGASLGFTDHDETLEFDGALFEASSGFTATELQSSLGLNIDNLDAAGALQSNRLAEEDLRSGRFDNAVVELWLVNWRDVSQRLLMRKGNLGEITRSAQAFTAEIRGLAHHLNQPMGRIYQYGCDASLGDERCAVDLSSALYRATATVAESESNSRFIVTGIETYEEGWFARGRLVWTTGANRGRSMEVRSHRDQTVDLWQPMASAIAVGDELVLTAGCDKQFSTCRSKFANALNFRGHPHMPGNDFVLSYASRD
jgi:uncharacterized phage protein (TIGR02218 family)